MLALAALGAGGFFWWKTQGPTPLDTSVPTAPSVPPAPPLDAGKPLACPADMILIEGGQFFMGTPKPPPGTKEKDSTENEHPEHQVTLGAYCIDKLEVTVERWVSCTSIGKCRFSPPVNLNAELDAVQTKLYDPVCNLAGVSNGGIVPEGKAKHPINCVDWDGARNFCESMGGRLPTEAEWEHAARGSDGRVYPWPEGPPGPTLLNGCGSECVAWGVTHPDPDPWNKLKAMYAADDGHVHTAPVGSFPGGASVYGLQDMTGNVWEWVSDRYALYPPESENTTQVDPKGSTEGKDRVIRGGGWNSSDPSWMRPSFRYFAPPNRKSHGVGFRCASTPT
ncbi:MAG: hypothetical protein EOO70_09815 [Myxococcaceae bacterium]|nr:MAG: hypothetical protein EOO70_09815 [Myxococcaceae bacterium]